MAAMRVERHSSALYGWYKTGPSYVSGDVHVSNVPLVYGPVAESMGRSCAR